MSKKASRHDGPQSPTPAATASGLFMLAGLAVASALWSAFQWNELLTLREGGEMFCAAGSAEGCATLADSGFALAVQRLTLLPVPGWGLVWSGAALALPLGALLRRAADGHEEPFWTATGIFAVLGVASIVVLAGVSGAEGTLCANCLITYAIVGAYAVAFGFRLSRSGGLSGLQLPMGAGVALVATAVGFGALLYPGLQTPFPHAQEASTAVADALDSHAPEVHDHASRAGGSLASEGTDENLVALLAAMNPDMKQALSDSIAAYASSRANGGSPPRALIGSAEAPVRITDFTDTLCGHCAQLHQNLAALFSRMPEGSFAIDARHFPLDGNCNPNISHKHESPVRCVAASAQICFEGHPQAVEFAGRLYAKQRSLDVDAVYALAAPHMSRSELQACIASETTRKKLQADIARAIEFDIHGTPLVLVNDRRGSAFPPFLYSMVITGGKADDPAFSDLPAPRPVPH